MGFCLFFVVVVALIVWVAASILRARDRISGTGSVRNDTPTGDTPQLTQASSAPEPKEPSGTIISQYPGTCDACGQRFTPGTRIYWKKGDPTRHYSCDGARREREAEAFARLMDRLTGSKGAAGRRLILSNAETSIQDPELRSRLILEASRLDAEGALEKAATLKTAAARRRRLQEALDALRSDPVPDELQAYEISLLEDALKQLDTEAG